MHFVGSADTEFTKRSCNLHFEGSGVHVFIAEDVSLCALPTYMKGFTIGNNQPQSTQSQIVKNIVESCNFARGSPDMTVARRLCLSRLAASQAGLPCWSCLISRTVEDLRWGVLSSARESGAVTCMSFDPNVLILQGPARQNPNH